MRKSLVFLILLTAIFLNSGCYYQALYNPAGNATFLWLPGIGQWKISERLPSGLLKESLDREQQQETLRRAQEQEAASATATDPAF